MNVKIICDSVCDMTRAQAIAQNVRLLPLRTLIDGVEYLDGVTITPEELYQRMAAGTKTLSTSQIPPYDFAQAYAEELADEADEAVVITISQQLSGTHQSACIAAADFPGRVHVVDSGSATVGERILLDYAIHLRNQGMSAADIAAELNRAKGRIRLIARVDTLEYLVRGGRLSRTAGFAGSLLSIKPILGVVNGEIATLGKSRGTRQSSIALNQFIENYGGIDFSMPVCLGYTGVDDTLFQEYIECSRDVWYGHTATLPTCVIGSTIGVHVGPGAVAVAFFCRG